jgi:hypothetical protein
MAPAVEQVPVPIDLDLDAPLAMIAELAIELPAVLPDGPEICLASPE